MSDKEEQELRIFQLCKELAKRLGDEEAIADLKALRNLHPEMFKDMQEVANLIQEVVTESKIIIVKNPRPMSEKDYIAGKKLNDKKMGEVGVRRDDNINRIFHANEKRLKNLDLLAKKDVVFDGRDAHTPYIQAQSLDGRLVENNISPNTESIIPQTQENQSIAEQIKAESKDFDTLSTNERLALLEKNRQAIAGMRMQSAKDLQQQNKDSMSIKQEKELKDSKNQESQIHKLKKRK